MAVNKSGRDGDKESISPQEWILDLVNIWVIVWSPFLGRMDSRKPAHLAVLTLIFFFPFTSFISLKPCKSGLCNHLAENREAEGRNLPEHSLTITVVNKAPLWPVLNRACIITRLESQHFPTLSSLKTQQHLANDLERKWFYFARLWAEKINTLCTHLTKAFLAGTAEPSPINSKAMLLAFVADIYQLRKTART